MIQYLFPFGMMGMSIGAAIVCAFGGDVRRVIYWLAAAVITASVTF